MKQRKPPKAEQQLRSRFDSLTETYLAAGRASDAEIKHLRDQLAKRIDTSMIDSRTKLASQMGQMVEAVAKAVIYLIGKENM